MTDKEQLIAMLERAGIEHEVDPLENDVGIPLGEGSDNDIYFDFENGKLTHVWQSIQIDERFDSRKK
jgi:hypothetical protein